jgi:hypothetical protein
VALAPPFQTAVKGLTALPLTFAFAKASADKQVFVTTYIFIYDLRYAIDANEWVESVTKRKN